jgi:hypothetical protein
MNKLQNVFVIIFCLMIAGSSYSQDPVLIGQYQDPTHFDLAPYGGQRAIYFHQTNNYIATGVQLDRTSINAIISLDGGLTWTTTEKINVDGEVRNFTVRGDNNSAQYFFTKRNDADNGAAPWARHRGYIAGDDFGWGGGSFSSLLIAAEGTEEDVLDSYVGNLEISEFDPNLRGVMSHHGSSQVGGEYQQFFGSTDGGATWSGRIKVVSSSSADSLSGKYVADLTTNCADIHYGPDGYILAAGTAQFDFDFEAAEHLWYAFSTDSGKTWSDVNIIPGSENIDVSWSVVDRGWNLIIDSDNNFHLFALASDFDGVWAAYDFKWDGSQWTKNRFLESQFINDGLVAVEQDEGDSGPLNAPTLNSDGKIIYSFIDVVDTTGGNDYRFYSVFSDDGGATWSGRVQMINDPAYNAQEFTDVAREADGALHIVYCVVDTTGGTTISQYYLQVPTSSVAKEIEVQAGTDQISAALSGAGNGDVLILVTDGGEYVENDSLVVDKRVTIKAADGLTNPPVWTTLDSTQNIYLQSDLILQGIVFEGSDTTEAAVYSNAAAPNKIVVDGCEFRNYKNDIIDAANTTTVDTVTVNNCYFHHSGDEGIEFSGDRTGEYGPKIPGVHYLSVENCTFNSLVGDAIKVYGESDGADSAVAVISHITVYNCERGIYFRALAKGTVVTNGIITDCDQGVRMRDSHTLEVTYSDIWNNTDNFRNDASAGTGTISEDPMFADAANGDFRLNSGSPCIGTGSDGQNMGDTNWGVVTSITSEVTQPVAFALSQNYPNPFNPSTTIQFSLAHRSKIELVVYDLIGRKVVTLVDGYMDGGTHQVTWDTSNDNFASGVYLYRLIAQDKVETRKLILLR